MTFTAPTRAARTVGAATYGSEDALCGIVTIRPMTLRSAFAPSRKSPSPDGSTCRGMQTASTPLSRKSALQTSGERACAMGSPMIPRTRVEPVGRRALLTAPPP
jgi:hypothetical protein